ncbi:MULTISPECIES: DUF427 domain-containing protein [Oceanotoga]|jgi:uncharacterized protein (DUF427 family)|uniref:Uncharacterized protein (DUF427 family) n=1 Tax=Oceanotoga teriensis TaxID=515440 RepID=A0AA45C5J8_9BACT|nr:MULTISPECIES: DUF427 domain-containing protein [Oceanotoga]MDN5341711.1 hypothetical protein [Oceanotoga sp.]MDO7976355.1 DUF427 domain-containing protein [Oceanotoga teriensis]PWJ89290.1 uncharacterized protein (DUF427 family) [Oceanotoga teriensis]
MLENKLEYPETPIIELVKKEIIVYFDSKEIAKSSRPLKILKKDLTPIYFINLNNVHTKYLKKSDKHYTSPIIGISDFYDLILENTKVENAAFIYSKPNDGYTILENYISFLPEKMDKVVLGDDII